jgi:hypothetical protein
MHTPIRCAVSLTLIAVAPVFARGDDLPTHRFKTGKSALAIPFELNSNKVFLPVRIDGGPERWFVLDSGCPVTAVDLTLARELGLPVKVQGQLTGAGEGTTTVGTTKVQSLSLPGLEWFPKSVWALAVSKPVAAYEGRRIDGQLGVDFLEKFVVRIDYPGRKVDVFAPEAFEPAGKGTVVPLTKRGTYYTVRATLGLKDGKSVEGRFIFDVGVRLPLLAATPFVNRNGLIEALGAGPLQTVGGGLGGETRAHPGRLKSLTIGDLKVDAPYVALSQEKRSFLAGDDTQGLLGGEIFRRYCLTLNFPAKQAIFTETPETQTSYEHDMSGLFLTAAGDDFRTFHVLSVVDSGPAARAGVRPGDTLVEIDGKPAAKWTLEQVRAAFKGAGATRVLTLQRRDERLTVKLLLQRLV